MRLFAVLTALSVAASASGDSCRAVRQRVVVQHHAAVAVKQAVIAPIAVAAYAPIVTVPQYSVGWDSGAGEVAELRKAIKELREAIQGLQGPGTGQGAQGNDVQVRAIKILTSHCARCHAEPVAKAEGGDFVMFKGGQINTSLSRDDLWHIWERSDSGSMPPPKKGEPISDDEARVLREWLGQVAKVERAARKQQPK